MGVHGLTSYVSHKSDLYLDDFQLKNCFLIIDGYSLASNLYNSSTKINSAFGGDYDKYAKIVEKFVEVLKKCNVTPIVICDGGYERRKVKTVKQRNLKRVYTFEKITPSCSNQQCFPLMMRHVFREKLLSLNVPLFQSDFEADNEIAALAKKIDAPVLSNDSDFFIFDVRYIPLSSIVFDSYEKANKGQFYIPCQIFHVDKLLYGLGGLPKTMLPLLATILGNDYIAAGQFKNFYSHLKIDKSKKTKPGQKRIEGLVKWLRGEDLDSALYKILKCLKKDVRSNVKRRIKSVIKGYTNLNTSLDSYLPEKITCRFQSKNNLSGLVDNFSQLACTDSGSEDNQSESNDLDYESDCSYVSNSTNDPSNSFNGGENSDSQDSFSDDEQCINVRDQRSASFPSWLIDESRKGNVCPSINTLLLLKTYFYVPQVEDYGCLFSGVSTLPILQVLGGLLGLDQISYWSRSNGRYIKATLEPIKHINEFSFPDLNELNQVTHLQRKLILLKTLKVDNELIESFPPDWRLYIASIVYWVKTNENPVVKPWYIHAVVMTLITVSIISLKVGMFWQKKTFMNRYGSKLKLLEKRILLKQDPLTVCTITEAINKVSEDDCILAMEHLLPYFHVDIRLNHHSRNFSRGTIHLYAQLQSIFELATSLNSLLLMPLERSNLSMFYNGTFLYNFTANFKTRPNILSYVETLFSRAPTISTLYKAVYDKLLTLIPSAPQQKIKIRKNKKRQKQSKEVEKNVSDNSDHEEFEDSNNKYSILLKKNSQ